MPISIKHAALWKRLTAYEFDRDPNAPFTFAQRVAKRNNWTHEYTLRVIQEYLRFLFLGVTTGRMVVPSVWVDEVWHIHLMYTLSYWVRLCHDILGQPFHHSPGDGADEDEERFTAFYAQTIEDYVETFGEPPPEDIWGHAHVQVNWREIIAKQARPRPPLLVPDQLGIFTTSPTPKLLQGGTDQLWAKLQGFKFDQNPNAPYTFAHRVAKRNGWEMNYTLRAIQEYLKFMFLMKVTGQQVAPSRWIDEILHVHLMYTQSYWGDMCRDILGEAVHHRPGNGTVAEAQDNAARVANAFVQYEKFFGVPPQDIWGKPDGVGWRKFVLGAPLSASVKFNVLEMFPHDTDEAIP